MSVQYAPLVAMTGYSVGGGDGLGGAMVESKAIDGCRERRSFRKIDERDRDGTKEHALSTTIA